MYSAPLERTAITLPLRHTKEHDFRRKDHRLWSALMAVFYQHIGEALSARDFPKSLGTTSQGMHRFCMKDILPFIEHLTNDEQGVMLQSVSKLSPEGFQIWGLPCGARPTVRSMESSDHLLLLESTHFRYFGTVIHLVSEMCHDLSRSIWGEGKFPIIVLLVGQFILYGWDEFCADFDFDPKYHMRGNTAKVGPNRFPNKRGHMEPVFVN